MVQALIPVPDSNKVFFGHLKAPVINASATSLTIKVPLKATFNKITVISIGAVVAGNNKYSAVSDLPFDVTFEDDGILEPNAFNIESIVYDTAYYANRYGAFAGDFDGDEKPDFAFGNLKFRNISLDTPRFASPVYTPTTFPGPPPNTSLTETVSAYGDCKDANGDGLPDLFAIVQNNSLGYVYTTCLKSIAGRFDSVKAGGLGIYNTAGGFSFPDLDNNGEGDMIYIEASSSLHGKIGGIERISSNHTYYYSCYSADFDGDGYKDIVGGFNYGGFPDEGDIEFFHNNLPNSTSFYPRNNTLDQFCDIPFGGGYNLRPTSILGGDFNNDGKVDLLIGMEAGGTYLLINSGSPGTISFLPSILLSYVSNISAVNDINGDGKPDIIAQKYVSGSGYVNYLYKNTSTGNTISFAAGIPWINGVMGDFEGDGKQDFLVLNGNKRSVLRHNPISNQKLCPGTAVSFRTPVTGAAFQWQLNTGSGFVNIADDATYSGTNTAALQLNNIPSGFYGYQYRCLVDNTPSGQFKISFENKWTGAVSSTWEDTGNWSCGSLPDSNTDVVITGGTVILNSSTTIRSLTVSPSANFTVAPSAVLTIIH